MFELIGGIVFLFVIGCGVVRVCTPQGPEKYVPNYREDYENYRETP